MASRRWLLSLAAVYFLLGFVDGTWFSRIPTEQARLGVGSGRLGLALLGLPLGSVAISLVVPRVLRRWGSRGVARLGLLGCSGALALLAIPRGVAALFGVLLVFGVSLGLLDVSMNANGVALQAVAGRSVFGRLHAGWSLGGFAGAAIGGVLVHAGLGLTAHLCLVAAAVALAGALIGRGLGHDGPAANSSPATEAASSWTRDPTVLALATAAFAALVIEVGASDWSGVFLRRTLHASSGLAAAAYASFALPHFAVRAVGDRIVDRLDGRRLMVVGLIVASLGYLVAVTAPDAALALVGFAVAGAGVGLVVPLAFSSAGTVAGVPAGSGVATSAGLGYLGYTAAPPIIGGLAAVAGLRVGLLLPVVTSVIAVVALRLRSAANLTHP